MFHEMMWSRSSKLAPLMGPMLGDKLDVKPVRSNLFKYCKCIIFVAGQPGWYLDDNPDSIPFLALLHYSPFLLKEAAHAMYSHSSRQNAK
jgi:hypothetical protein